MLVVSRLLNGLRIGKVSLTANKCAIRHGDAYAITRDLMSPLYYEWSIDHDCRSIHVV